MSRNNRIETANKAIGLGVLAQVSRNKKINGLGELSIFVGIITLIGEILKFIFNWCIIKPCILIFKGFWLCFKYIIPPTIAFVMALFQYSYKYIRKLADNYKDKKNEPI